MEKDYSYYTATDFARDPDFLKWVKYPESNRQLELFWISWLNDNPSKKDDVTEARELIYAVLEQKYVPTEEKQVELWRRITTTIEDDGDETWDNQTLITESPKGSEVLTDTRQEKHFMESKMWLAIAFSIVVFVSVSYLGWRYFNRVETHLPGIAFKNYDLTTEINNDDFPKTVWLNDGSSVVLQPGSKLEFPDHFGKSLREVHLDGEAFFEVKKDPSTPFMVYTHDIVTRVLGTSFNVRNFQNEDLVIKVKTGKVSVFKEKENSESSRTEGVILTPNQQVVYERTTMHLTKSLIEEPEMLTLKTKHDFEFTDTPVTEVFSEIELAYGLDLVYDEEVLSDCKLNASLAAKSFHDKLKLICQAIDASYEQIDSHIIIYGKGCSNQ